ncbi:MAG: GspH/FimT family protein [Pseudomonadota bacterium]
MSRLFFLCLDPFRMAGLTRIEMIVSIALLLILAAIAVPALREMLQNNRLTTQMSSLMGDINLARSEAIKRGVRVTVCQRGGQPCDTATGSWKNGWTVFVDADPSNRVYNGETLLRVHETLPSSLAVNDNFTGYISYIPEGYTQKINGAFQSGSVAFCDPSGKWVRRLVVSKSGRPRLCNQNDTSCTLSCP